MKILGDEVTGPYVPTDGCGNYPVSGVASLTIKTLFFTSDERVTKIEVWRNNSDHTLLQIKFTLNTGATRQSTPSYTGNSSYHFFEIPVN